MKKNVLFVCPTQYGYNTDYYKYCEHLSLKYNVYYIGLELNKPKRFEYSSVHVIHVKRHKNRIGGLSLLFSSIKLGRKIHFDKVFIYYDVLCSLFLLFFNRSKCVVDIRTAFIGKKKKARILNTLMKYETNIFSVISVISDGVGSFLCINKNKMKILPLGSEPGICEQRRFDTYRLLYVGTFNDRNIDVTIKAVDKYISLHNLDNVHYYLIGNGNKTEVEKIVNAIRGCENKLYFNYFGEVYGNELSDFYEKCNVGISYIPLNDYYDNQPPTKTYEYLLNSMAVIATPTKENAKVVNKNNGVLLKGENMQDFIDGLEILSQLSFDTLTIYKDNQCYSWGKLTNDFLIPIIES